MLAIKLLICYCFIIKEVQARTRPKVEVRSTGFVRKQPPENVAIDDIILLCEGILVQHGHPIEIYCIGEQPENLSLFWLGSINDMIYHYVNAKLETAVVNDTATKHVMQDPERLFNLYTCGYGEKPFVGETPEVDVFVWADLPPEPRGFECVWSLGRESIVVCKWSFPTLYGDTWLSFKLKGRDQGTCQREIERNNTCIWNAPRHFADAPYCQFNLLACNDFGCANKTYSISTLSIIRPDPPTLWVESKSSHYVVLGWSVGKLWQLLNSSNLEHNVEYWMHGIEFRKANSTPVQTSYVRFEVGIDLPCARKTYEVRVSIKPKEADERYWSEYAHMSFVTEPAEGAIDKDPICQKPDIELNGWVMEYEVKKLRQEVLEKLRNLKTQTSRLREKVKN